MAMIIENSWPEITTSMRPWTRWWWHGSAVDPENLSRLLREYHQAGLGGVEITPIYGVKGAEDREIRFLSDDWLEMLCRTITEAHSLGLGVDMNTGTGWPFGGPHVTDSDADDKLVIECSQVAGGDTWTGAFGIEQPQSATAYGTDGSIIHLELARSEDGSFSWTAPAGDWTVYCAGIKWAGRMVKRAAPGGEGKCANPFSQQSVLNYLQVFDSALASVPPNAIRCQFHDSFEYLADWSPDFFTEFERRRGYDLSHYLRELAGSGDSDTIARVKTDYRETLSDMLRENFTKTWTSWVNDKGSLSRNQAHGSPGNLLDLYGTADIPETEIFGNRTDPRVNKFASSPAHILGKPLVSSETCTWLGEHFNVSLALAKEAIDGLYLAGINHILYHGLAYSPEDAQWPGWLFYASTTFAPQDPIWTDLPQLNAYITRCQSLLQSGAPDNDILLYWPLHDLWQKHIDAYMFEIGGKWFVTEAIADTAQQLLDMGYGYDYISDRQLTLAHFEDGRIHVPGGGYRAIVVPPCEFMPVATFELLVNLARSGAYILFQDHMPSNVPGLYDLVARQTRLRNMVTSAAAGCRTGSDLKSLLEQTQARQELMTCENDINCIRRRTDSGCDYFLVNRGKAGIDRWVPFATPAASAHIMDPMTGKSGKAASRRSPNGFEVYLQMQSGESLFLRTSTEEEADLEFWPYYETAGEAISIEGVWNVEFISGGPQLPAALQIRDLKSWTDLGIEGGDSFAGTARYTIMFDAPDAGELWMLDLGQVCESARVVLNEVTLGTLIAPPYHVRVVELKPKGNVLEIEVTNLAANRIRDMDRKGAPWKIFHDINIVNLDYKPFDASDWSIRPSGLLGPVRLTPIKMRRF